MPLGKQEEIWRGCEETRGCVRGLGGEKRGRGPNRVEKSGSEFTRGVLCYLQCKEMTLGKQEEIWRGCEDARLCLRGLGGPRRPGGPNSVEKGGPECTRGVLNGLHYQEMPLGKQKDIWRGCQETRGCLRSLGVPKTAGGPYPVEKSGPECTRRVLRYLRCQEMPLGKQEEIWRS